MYVARARVNPHSMDENQKVDLKKKSKNNINNNIINNKNKNKSMLTNKNDKLKPQKSFNTPKVWRHFVA